jgi:hypothetical protein
MKFFPPSQLPPLQRHDGESSEENGPPAPPPSLKRVAEVVASLLLGSGVAEVGYYLSGNYTWFAAIPVVLVLGWLSAGSAKPLLESKSSRPSKGGPVLW